MAPLPTTSVVIPTYNRGVGVLDIVDPLLADDDVTEVVVVVDGSTDGTYEALQRRAADDPRLVPLWQENAGEGAARQRGAEEAVGDVLLFLDDDVLAAAGLVRGHARHHVRGEERVVLGYMPPRPPGVGYPDAFAIRLYAESYERRCSTYEERPAEVLHHLWAGNMSLPRQLALAVGMDNPRYTERYHPDRDLGLRLLAHGASGTFDRSLAAVHLYRRDLAAFRRDARSQGAAAYLLSELHGDLAGNEGPVEAASGAPGAVAGLLRLARRRRFERGLGGALVGAMTCLGAVHAVRSQMVCARVLRRLEQQRGAMDYRAGRR